MHHLETVQLDGAVSQQADFSMPVQWVNRPDLDFRGFAGKIASGAIKRGDEVRILPSGRTSCVDRIVTFDGDVEQANAGQSVTLTLTDEIDCSQRSGDHRQLKRL